VHSGNRAAPFGISIAVKSRNRHFRSQRPNRVPSGGSSDKNDLKKGNKKRKRRRRKDARARAKNESAERDILRGGERGGGNAGNPRIFSDVKYTIAVFIVRSHDGEITTNGSGAEKATVCPIVVYGRLLTRRVAQLLQPAPRRDSPPAPLPLSFLRPLNLSIRRQFDYRA